MDCINVSLRKMEVYENRGHHRSYLETVDWGDGRRRDLSSMEEAHQMRKDVDPSYDETTAEIRSLIAEK